MTDITYAVFGDSTSHRPDSWMNQMAAIPGFLRVPGYTMSGATTADVLAAAEADTRPHVAVVMLGTNDVPLPNYDRSVAYQTIQDLIAKVKPLRVLLNPIVPNSQSDPRRDAHVVFNRDLMRLVYDNGWFFADPCYPFRTFEGEFKAGTSTDGRHPNTAASATMAARQWKYIQHAAAGL